MILLDTHVLVWVNAEVQRLSTRARRALIEARRAGGLAVAAMTLFEVAALLVRGRLQAVGTVEQAVIELVEGTTVLPVTPAIAAIAASLPREFPGDPGDRLITATAIAHGLVLVTADAAIRQYRQVRTIW
jgi:PIN domain nuclease of toxin-antitoxin system